MTGTHQNRWMIRRDYEAALAIPNAAIPWTHDDLRTHNENYNNISLIAEDEDCEVCGWVSYLLGETYYHIANMAVCPQRQGIGTAIIQSLVDKLGHGHRSIITTEVPETATEALCFFRQCGFLVSDQGKGVILLRYTLPEVNELFESDGVFFRRSSGWPLLLPEGF